MRASLKSSTVAKVRDHFKDLDLRLQKTLLDEDEYWYKLSAVSHNSTAL